MALFDIHEQKQNQESLQSSGRRLGLKAILDSASDLLVMVVDLEKDASCSSTECASNSPAIPWKKLEAESRGSSWCRPMRCRGSWKAFEEGTARGPEPNPETHWLAKDGRHLVIGWSNTGVAVDGSGRIRDRQWYG